MQGRKKRRNSKHNKITWYLLRFVCVLWGTSHLWWHSGFHCINFLFY